MPFPTGTAETRLVVLRGNSAAGKSSVAGALRERYGYGIALVAQDNLRRVVLREKDVPGGINIGLIDATARYALDHGYHVIVEGILYAARYGVMLRQLRADHRGVTGCYYLDVGFEESLKRHASRPQAAEFGEAEMRSWFTPEDLVTGLDETVLGNESTFDAVVERIWDETGLLSVPRSRHRA
ncbi:kinase [Streptomonospora alba]|uniref:Kinase n=1 Tax=Streptomonospora alba TaxID=183763 RepID=A0A0C2JFD1_9ACTN|nr:kinase [Streptomonospora alba]KIH97615.1 kinase [Streptomonospora alba]